MEIIIQPDRSQASQIAARIVARLVREKPHAVLGLASAGAIPAVVSAAVHNGGTIGVLTYAALAAGAAEPLNAIEDQG